MVNWIRKMLFFWRPTEKDTYDAGEKLLNASIARESRVDVVTAELERFRAENHIAAQLQYVFTEGRRGL